MGKTLTKEKQSDKDSLDSPAKDDQASIAKLLSHPLFLQSTDPLLSTMIEPLKNILQNHQNNTGSEAQWIPFMDCLDQVLPQGHTDEFNKVNESNKTKCWKVIPMNEVYFRCLDCETGEDSSILFLQCKECFENANHTGHRVIKCQPTVEGCTCDCGTPGIRLEGTCPAHVPKQQTIEEALADFPQEVRQKFNDAFKKVIYGIMCFCEIQEKAKSEELKSDIRDYALQCMSDLLFFYSYASDNLSKSFNLVVERIFRSTFEAPNNLVWHDCNDLKDEYLAKNSELESPQECSCTVLGCILRFSKHLDKDCQSRLKALLIESCKEETSIKFLNREMGKYVYFLLGDPSSSNKIKKCPSELESANRCGMSIEEDDVQYLDNLLGALKRSLKKSELYKDQCDSISGVLCALANFLTIRSKASEIALYNTNLMNECLAMLSYLNMKSLYPGEMRLDLFEHHLTHKSVIYQFIVEKMLCMVLDHGLKMLGDLSIDKRVPAFRNISIEWLDYFQKYKIQEREYEDYEILYKRQINPLSGLEKTLCLMIMHYLEDNITKESIEEFFKTIFQDIYPSSLASNVIKGPLTTLGLMRFTEITKTTNLAGYSLYFLFNNIFDIDIVGIQLMTLLVKPQELLSLFATNFFSFAQEIVDFCLSYSTESIESLKNHPYSRQMILALEDFLNFFIYLMNDEISLMNLNLRRKVSRKRPDFPPERVVKKVFVNILAEMTWLDVGIAKQISADFICQEIWTPVDSIIAKIVTVDDEKNKVKLKKEYESELDPYIFYKHYHSHKARQNNLTSEEIKTQDRDIVSGKFYTDLPSYLTDIQQNIFQSQLPEFVSYILINFTNEIRLLLQPALKLALFNLQVVSETLENPNTNTEGLQEKVEKTYLTKDFSQSLNKILADGNYQECEKCIKNIQVLIKQLSSQIMMRQSLGQANFEENKEDIAAEKKRQAKEKMEKLKEQFAKKQAAFAEKNEDLKIHKDIKSPDQATANSLDRSDLVCQYCLDKIDELSGDEYGVPLYIEFTNSFYNTEEEIVFKTEDYADLCKAKWWPVISSCHHSYHRRCFDKHCLSSRGSQNEASQFFSNEMEGQCALCKRLNNSFLVMNTDFASKSSENSCERYILVLKELLALRIESLLILQGSERENTAFDTDIPEILKRGYEYFVESFHLHKNAHPLSQSFELYLNFFKTLKHYPAIKDLFTSVDDKSFFKRAEKTNVIEKSYSESLANSLLFNILLEKCSQANVEKDFEIDEHLQIIKEYFAYNLLFLARLEARDSPIQLTDLRSFYKENKEIRTKALNELAFPMQKLLLAYYLNRCILYPSQSTERSEFCRLLSSTDNTSEKLDLLLKQAGFSLSFDQLIEMSLLLIYNISGSEKTLLSLILRPETPIPQIGKLKLAPQFHFVSLPQTYLEFSQRYLYKGCDLCLDKHKDVKSICLLCGKCLCAGSCDPVLNSQPFGNLSMHAAQCHMGLGLFFKLDLYVVVLIKGLLNLVDFPGPIYVNELGESIHNLLAKKESVPRSTNFEKFVLNSKVLVSLERIVMSHGMGQNIFEKAPLHTDLEWYYEDAKF